MAASLQSSIAIRDVGLVLGGRQILKDTSLDIRPGEFVCVVGPSGCGKTTLLRLIAGLIAPTEGKIRIGERDHTGPSRDIGIVFQDYDKALLPWRTAAENVALSLEAMGTPRAKRRDVSMDFLRRVGLAHHADKFPRQLSGGMQQRVQIARALAQTPDVLLMDEPFGALDAMTRQGLQDELGTILDQAKTTVFFVTHDLEEAIYLGDRVIGLLPNPGRIGETFEVNLPRPRDQLATREHSEFLRLRRELFQFIKSAES